MPEYVVRPRVTRYETALVAAASGEEAVETARREGRFTGAFEKAENDALEATAAEVVEWTAAGAASVDRPDAPSGTRARRNASAGRESGHHVQGRVCGRANALRV